MIRKRHGTSEAEPFNIKKGPNGLEPTELLGTKHDKKAIVFDRFIIKIKHFFFRKCPQLKNCDPEIVKSTKRNILK